MHLFCKSDKNAFLNKKKFEKKKKLHQLTLFNDLHGQVIISNKAGHKKFIGDKSLSVQAEVKKPATKKFAMKCMVRHPENLFERKEFSSKKQ